MEEQKGHMKLSQLILAVFILTLWSVMGLGVLPGNADQIKKAEERIDSALWGLEKHGELAEALERYQAVAMELESLEVEAQSTDYNEQQRVLAYAYLRIGNVLRQLGRSDEALQAGVRELECARESGNDITLVRCGPSLGAPKEMKLQLYDFFGQGSTFSVMASKGTACSCITYFYAAVSGFIYLMLPV